jgi:TolB-like protein
MVAIGGASVAAAFGAPLALNWGGLRDRVLGAPRQITSIAVLPLANLSGDPDQEYFSDGMTESLIADLAKLSSLKVISRTSAMTFKGANKPLREIAAELGVDAILEGSAVRSGDRIRITAQLIDAKTDQHLWAESYERDFGDMLVVQSEVARAVAMQIRAQLTAQEQSRLASARPVNPEAQDAYLRGAFLSQRINATENLDTAQRYFELALQKQPDYALAYAGIAWVWLVRQQRELVPPAEAGPKVTAAAERALALDSGLGQVHHTLALMKGWVQWDWAGAEASFRRAIELSPNYPDARVFYANLLTILRRTPEALPQIERALDLDPLNALFRTAYASILNDAGRYDDAISQAQRALAVEPDQQQADNAIRTAYFHKGMLKEAIEVALRRRVGNRQKQGKQQVQEVLRRYYDQGRYREAARAAAEVIEARWRAGEFPFGLPVYYTLAGERDKLLAFYEWAVDQHNPTIPGGIRDGARAFPELESNPRYQALLRRVGLPQ